MVKRSTGWWPLGETRTWSYTDYSWNIVPTNYSYSGCTCPAPPAVTAAILNPQQKGQPPPSGAAPDAAPDWLGTSWRD